SSHCRRASRHFPRCSLPSQWHFRWSPQSPLWSPRFCESCFQSFSFPSKSCRYRPKNPFQSLSNSSCCCHGIPLLVLVYSSARTHPPKTVACCTCSCDRQQTWSCPLICPCFSLIF